MIQVEKNNDDAREPNVQSIPDESGRLCLVGF